MALTILHRRTMSIIQNTDKETIIAHSWEMKLKDKAIVDAIADQNRILFSRMSDKFGIKKGLGAN